VQLRIELLFVGEAVDCTRLMRVDYSETPSDCLLLGFILWEICLHFLYLGDR
jgi:hypothetical protein